MNIPEFKQAVEGDKPSAKEHNKLTALAAGLANGLHIQGYQDSTGFHTRRSPKPNPIHLAYCKDDAGAGEQLDCYLDTDAIGEVVEVNFSIAQAGANLNACLPLLGNGDLIFVSEIQGIWYCIQIFNESIACDCYEEPAP